MAAGDVQPGQPEWFRTWLGDFSGDDHDLLTRLITSTDSLNENTRGLSQALERLSNRVDTTDENLATVKDESMTKVDFAEKRAVDRKFRRQNRILFCVFVVLILLVTGVGAVVLVKEHNTVGQVHDEANANSVTSQSLLNEELQRAELAEISCIARNNAQSAQTNLNARLLGAISSIPGAPPAIVSKFSDAFNTYASNIKPVDCTSYVQQAQSLRKRGAQEPGAK